MGPLTASHRSRFGHATTPPECSLCAIVGLGLDTGPKENRPLVCLPAVRVAGSCAQHPWSVQLGRILFRRGRTCQSAALARPPPARYAVSHGEALPSSSCARASNRRGRVSFVASSACRELWGGPDAHRRRRHHHRRRHRRLALRYRPAHRHRADHSAASRCTRCPARSRPQVKQCEKAVSFLPTNTIERAATPRGGDG